MPLYEYICEQDGTVLELMRAMAEADRPVEDPEARGRTFTRKFSTFAAGGSAASASATGLPMGGCCPCGKNQGMCGS